LFCKPLQRFKSFRNFKVSIETLPFKLKKTFHSITLYQKLGILLTNGVAFATICGSVIAIFKGYQSWKITNDQQKEKKTEKQKSTEE